MVQDRARRVFPAHVVDSPVMNADGDLIGIIGISTDISARKRSDELRRQTELRFRRLVESNVQGVAFFTAAGVLTEANDAVLQLLGYTREDLAAGRLAWTALTPPEYAALDQQASRELADKGVAKPYEKELIRRDGLRIPVLIGSARLDDQEEGVAFVVDLTERKKLEKQFLRAQRLESIGTLAGGIAHDLNNVLTPILMSIELLGELNPGPENQAILQTLQSQRQPRRRTGQAGVIVRAGRVRRASQPSRCRTCCARCCRSFATPSRNRSRSASTRCRTRGRSPVIPPSSTRCS